MLEPQSARSAKSSQSHLEVEAPDGEGNGSLYFRSPVTPLQNEEAHVINTKTSAKDEAKDRQETKASQQYRTRLIRIQKIIAVISVILMGLGGAVFGLGVLLRPVIRTIGRQHFQAMNLGLNGLLFSGVLELVAGGFSCLSSSWLLVTPMYFGIGICILASLYQAITIAAATFLYIQSEAFPSDEIYRAWFLWECETTRSCRKAYLIYVYSYMVPQVILILAAIILQVAAIYFLCQVLAILKERRIAVTARLEAEAMHVETRL